MNRRSFLVLGAATVGCTGGGARLNVFNWSSYVAPDTIPNFEREFGVRVRYAVYESNEEMLARVFCSAQTPVRPPGLMLPGARPSERDTRVCWMPRRSSGLSHRRCRICSPKPGGPTAIFRMGWRRCGTRRD